MLMKTTDISRLIDWLGREGAIAGLEHSRLTVEELLRLARMHGLNVDNKMRRNDIIDELVNSKVSLIEKTDDDLMAMSSDELMRYFEIRRVSRTEILRLLARFGIRPGSEYKKSLRDFAAREISDFGMFQRVAKGRAP